MAKRIRESSPSEAINKVEHIELVDDSEGGSVAELEVTQASLKRAKMAVSSDSEEAAEEDQENKDMDIDPEACEYEKLRLKNLAEKRAFLEALNKEMGVETVIPRKKPSKQKDTPRLRPVTRKQPVIQRRSLRLQKLKAEPIESLQQKEVVPEPVGRKRSHGTLTFQHSNLSDDDNLQDLYSLIEKIGTKEITLSSSSSSLSWYRDQFHSMRLTPDFVTKVTARRISAIAVHPTTSAFLAIAGSVDGHIGFLSLDADLKRKAACSFEVHGEYMIRRIGIHEKLPHHVYSCSSDGTVRCGDIEKKKFFEIYETPEDGEIQCMYFDFLDPFKFVVTHNDGTIGIGDTRSDKKATKSPQEVHRLSDRKLKCVNVHPVQSNYIVTSTATGMLDIWDIRALKKKPRSVCSVHENRNSTTTFFSPVTGNLLLSTCWDNKIRIYDTSSFKGDLNLIKEFNHDNQTGRWLTPFEATWLPNNEEAFVIGCMKYPRMIQIINTNGHCIHKFADEPLNSVSSLNAFHPSRPILVGANSSGRMFLFK